MQKIVSGMVFTFLLIGTLTLAFNVGLVRAQAPVTVYITSDGSVSPSSAPISSIDNVTYTFTGNISYPTYYGIVVERSDIVIDGNGYMLQGNYSGNGISLTGIGNVTIENANILTFQDGINLSGSNNTIVSGNNVTAKGYGIVLESSSNNIVSGNDATAIEDGIALNNSSSNTVSGNNATANSFAGIHLFSSSNNTVSGNNVTANGYGIEIDSSSNNTVSGNDATANGYGIDLGVSSGNVLSANVMEDNRYNFDVFGFVLSDFMNSVDTSNLVNGKPVYYITSKSNLVISPENYQNIGYLAVVNCTNVTVQGLTLTNDWQGILLAFTNDSKITDNNVTNDFVGIYLFYSSNNTLNGNTATANGGDGIDLEFSSNNIVSGNNVTANGSYGGIWLDSSSNNIVSGNNVTANGNGIGFDFSSNYNTVIGNNASANSYIGIYVSQSNNNEIYHNDFVNNKLQVASDDSMNVWDDGYPSGGNYWSDYNGSDLKSGQYQNVTGSDGIGDMPYVIGANNRDNYPLMGRFSDFKVAEGVDVQVVSNSTVSDFQFNGTAILFNVSGVNDTTGFCNVCVPTALLNGALTVYVNGAQVQYSLLPSLSSTQTYLYFNYGHSTEQVTIMPEFPDSLILAMFMLVTLLAVAIYKKKHSRF